MRLTKAYCLIILGLLTSCNDELQDNRNTGPLSLNSVITLGGSLNDSGQSITKTNDGGYAILGHTQSIDGDITDKTEENFDYWILKFDDQDQIQWQKTFGGSDNDRGRSLIQTQDGGYTLIGSSASNNGDVTVNNGAQDYWLIKLDASGNMSWQKSFGFTGNDIGISLIQTNDQGYLLSGILDVTASGGQGNTSRIEQRHAGGDYWVLKLDATGNLEWSRYFGGNFTDTPEGVVQTNDNGYIIAGGSDSEDTDISNNLGSYDFWVIKIDATGNLVWEKSFGGTEIDEAKGIVKANDGNFVIAGETRSNSIDVNSNNGAADLWLIKIDNDGNLLWEKNLGGSSFDVARSISLARDNGFLLSGSSRSSDGDVSENKGQNDAWVVKVDATGNIEWETTVGGANIDFAYGVSELNNGFVVAVGDTSSNDGDISVNKGFSDVLIMKFEN